jgi:hypothetical protein
MLEFEIVQIVDVREKEQYIYAKQIGQGNDFIIKSGAYLGDIELEEYLDVPRALDDQGQQRQNLFVFKTKQQIDKAKLRKGMIVKLVTPK